MENIDTGHLIIVALWAAVLGYWFFANNRQSLGKVMQQGIAWVLIFLGVISVVALWQDIEGAVIPNQQVFADDSRIEIPLSNDGHYYLTAEVNGAPIRFIVDTGATDIVLSNMDAAKAGIDTTDLPFFGRAMTANGEVRTARVWLEDMRIGDFVDTDVSASITDGEMGGSLLGMSYLQKYDQITITGRQMILTR